MMTAPPSAYQIAKVTSLARQTAIRLREEDGLVLDTEDEIIAALKEEGVAVDIVLSRLIRAILDAKAIAAATDARINDLRDRRARFHRREEAYRGTLAAVLETLGLRRYADPEASVYVTDGRSKVIITDAAAIPPALVETTVLHTPDKARIAEAIQRGDVVPGATLANPAPIVTVRSK